MTYFSNQGWECPKCGSIYAPFVTSCFSCSKTNYKTGDLTSDSNTQVQCYCDGTCKQPGKKCPLLLTESE